MKTSIANAPEYFQRYLRSPSYTNHPNLNQIQIASVSLQCQSPGTLLLSLHYDRYKATYNCRGWLGSLQKLRCTFLSLTFWPALQGESSKHLANICIHRKVILDNAYQLKLSMSSSRVKHTEYPKETVEIVRCIDPICGCS